MLHGQLGRLMAAVAAFEIGKLAATLLIPGRGTDTAIALALYTGYDLAATAASLPAGRLADRLGSTGPVQVLTAGVAPFIAAGLGWMLIALTALAFNHRGRATSSPTRAA